MWVNGAAAGLRICPPFRFDITRLFQPGDNRLRIEVANTPQREVIAMPKDPKDIFGKLFQPGVLAPSGIVGEVSLYLR